MAETEVHEKLARVLVRYEPGRIEPVALRWGTRDLRVLAVNARWVDRATRPIRYFFSVHVDSEEVLVLSWREGESVWYVDSVLTV